MPRKRVSSLVQCVGNAGAGQVWACKAWKHTSGTAARRAFGMGSGPEVSRGDLEPGERSVGLDIENERERGEEADEH